MDLQTNINSKPKNNGGYTLMELIVSIFLGLFVATIIFAGYTNMFRGFRLQAKRADTVREMIMVRRSVGRALDSIGTITLVTPMKIGFTRKGSVDEHSVEFRDSIVVADDSGLLKNVKKFSFEEVQNKSADGYRLVRWECVLNRGGWIGGVCIVRD
ncbi:MAG: prepilin-type N-terminal cleavage/methylation domain-containing protein [Chitinispirillaceae bacterium]|jgi:type II secretory pathway component PulJ